jgi:hypothetical protein
MCKCACPSCGYTGVDISEIRFGNFGEMQRGKFIEPATVINF